VTAGKADQQPSLLALSCAASEGSKTIFKWRFGTRLAVLATGCGALFIPTNWDMMVYALSVLALILEGIVWLLTHYAQSKHRLGDAARRHAMLADAFGDPEPLEDAELRRQFSKSDERRAALLENPNYYASTASHGLARLAKHLQESAFWSKDLYQRAAARTYGLFALLATGVLACALLALPTVANESALLIARVIVLVLGVVIGVDLLGRAISWAEAARQAERVDARLRPSGARRSTRVMLGILAEYAVATAGCPPIPTDLHMKEFDRLNKLWGQRRSPMQDQP
jgi:hypothetical protein